VAIGARTEHDSERLGRFSLAPSGSLIHRLLVARAAPPTRQFDRASLRRPSLQNQTEVIVFDSLVPGLVLGNKVLV